MKKIFILLIPLMLISLTYVSAQSTCDGIPEFVTELRQVFSSFPPAPASDDEADAILKHLEQSDPALLRKATSTSKRYILLNADQRVCVASQFMATPSGNDGDVNFWFQHIAKQIPYPLRSPEFRKGFGLHIDLNHGVADLGVKTESYSAAARALLSFTAGHKGHSTGGRWRAMAGASTYYYDTDFHFFFNPRVEYRIKDFALGDLATIGNLKAIVDVNIGNSVIAGAGVGAEFHFAGIQILYQRQSEEHNSHFLVGLFIRAFQ